MANKIKEMMKKNGLKPSQVIDKTGLSKSYFYDVMNEKSIPSLINARKISKVIGVPLNELFPESSNVVQAND